MLKILFAIALLATSISSANPEAAEALLKDGKTLYAQRENIAKIDELNALLEKSEATIQAGVPATQFQLRILSGRALYYKAMYGNLTKDQKLVTYEKSMAQHTKSKTAGDFADSNYFYASSLGRWAETKGISESLGRKNELMKELNTAIEKKTSAGQAGETFEAYGPRRVLGRMYAKLPTFAGGSKVKAKEHLDYSYNKAPQFISNVTFRAELYASGTAEEKAEACSSLEKLLKLDPVTMDPDRIPENKDEFEKAKELKTQICGR